MRRTLLLTLLLLAGTAFAQTAYRPLMSVLGDSYSTFAGYVEPAQNKAWYPRPKQNDCVAVEQTWWHLLASEMGWRICQNNSYSGATVCNTGYDKNDYTDRSYTTRMTNLGSPDIIFIFGGTNDSWANSPMGNFKYADWTPADLYQYRPAMAYLLDYMQKRYLNVKLYVILNNELSESLTNSTVEICQHYNVPCIQLHDIHKQQGHPSKKGMRQIADQIKEKIRN